MATTAAKTKWLSATETAEMLGATGDSVRRWATHGVEINGVVIRLACTHAGTEYRFTEADVREFSDRCGAAKRGELAPSQLPPSPEEERLAASQHEFLKKHGAKATA